MRRWACVFLGTVLFASNAWTEGTSLTPEQAADQAVVRGEAGKLEALAQLDVPDPWLVADELCIRGEYDAAHAYARAAPRPDVEDLPGYVSAQRHQKVPYPSRAKVTGMEDAISDNTRSAGR